MWRSPAAGKVPQRSSSVSLNRWRCAKSSLENVSASGRPSYGASDSRPPTSSTSLRSTSNPSAPSTSSEVSTGKWLTPVTDGRHGVGRAAQRDGQVHAEVAHLVAEPDRLDAGLPADRPGQRGHRVGDVEQPGVGAVLLHRLADADQDRDVAQRAVDAAGPDGVAHGLGDAVRRRHVEVDRHGAEAPGRDAHDDEVGAVEGDAEVGGGGDGGLGPHGVVELVGQRLHLGERPRIDVLEHQVHAGECRCPEEVGHQLRPPLIAAAADDRHIGCSRRHSTVPVVVGLRRRAPLALAAVFTGSGDRPPGPTRSPSRRSCRAPSPRSTTPTLIHVSGVVELACAAGLVRRSRWAAAGQRGHPGRRLPGQRADGPRRRDRPQPGTGGQPPVAWGRLPLQLVMVWVALAGTTRTRAGAEAVEIRASAPVTTGSSRRPRICSTARPRLRRRRGSSARRATTSSSPTRTSGPSGS